MHRIRRVLLAFALAVVTIAPSAAPSAARGAGKEVGDVRVVRYDGFDDPATPDQYDRVGVIEVGPRRARNILILNPGTSASAAYFVPLAKTIAERAKGWQVWSVERRENLLEDHSLLDRGKAGTAGQQEVFDYYLGWLANPAITTHFRLIPDDEVGFARGWGMRVEMEDLRRVVQAAVKRRARRIVVGGHSLGGSMTTAYATWDFDGVPGAKGLAGLVFIDGASRPTAMSAAEATAALQSLATSSPWLTFGGIPSPFTGLFNSTGSLGALQYPDSPSLGQQFPLLPANLKPPVPATNLAQYGYALDVDTSPPGLAAAQAHLGQLAASGTPRGWDQAGDITPIQRYAEMFSGWGLEGLDGTAWYHPLRLTIDAGAVAAGNANPAQAVLDVRAIHGHDLPKHLKMLAFGAALGGANVPAATTLLAQQSGIPAENLVLLDRQETYAHNDPNSAYPQNEFIDALIPFLGDIRRSREGRVIR